MKKRTSKSQTKLLNFIQFLYFIYAVCSFFQLHFKYYFDISLLESGPENTFYLKT